MAKKIVRGITDVKTITNQDFDTNNVNDLLSDGQYNYIHRKKGKSEEYHNLTDNIKTISSDNTDLLTVTNNNKTTNTATLHPKHDVQKEQVLESTRNTISIHHGTNGTDEKTTVDTNPAKVLEHENLISNSEYVTIEHVEGSSTSEIKTDKLVTKLKELDNKIPTEIGSCNLLRKTSVNADNLNLFGKKYATVTVVEKDGQQVYKIVPSGYSGAVPNDKGAYFGANDNYYNLVKGRSYTFSFWVLTNKDKPYNYNSLGHIQVVNKKGNIVGNDPDHQHTSPSYSTNTIKANLWTKVWCTFKATSNSYFRPAFWYISDGDEIYIYDMMLNEGKIPLSYTPALEDIQDKLNTTATLKQNKLTAMGGISITGDSISLTTIDQYREDLNNLNYTCLVKPADNTPNLPTGEDGNGILTVVRIGNVVSQKYHVFRGNKLYIRACRDLNTSPRWSEWTLLTQTGR